MSEYANNYCERLMKNYQERVDESEYLTFLNECDDVVFALDRIKPIPVTNLETWVNEFKENNDISKILFFKFFHLFTNSRKVVRGGKAFTTRFLKDMDKCIPYHDTYYGDYIIYDYDGYKSNYHYSVFSIIYIDTNDIVHCVNIKLKMDINDPLIGQDNKKYDEIVNKFPVTNGDLFTRFEKEKYQYKNYIKIIFDGFEKYGGKLSIDDFNKCISNYRVYKKFTLDTSEIFNKTVDNLIGSIKIRFGKVNDNNKTNTFDYVDVFVSITQMDYSKEELFCVVKANIKAINKRVEKLLSERVEKKFGVPINFLKVDNLTLTHDNILCYKIGFKI